MVAAARRTMRMRREGLGRVRIGCAREIVAPSRGPGKAGNARGVLAALPHVVGGSPQPPPGVQGHGGGRATGNRSPGFRRRVRLSERKDERGVRVERSGPGVPVERGRPGGFRSRPGHVGQDRTCALRHSSLGARSRAAGLGADVALRAERQRGVGASCVGRIRVQTVVDTIGGLPPQPIRRLHQEDILRPIREECA